MKAVHLEKKWATKERGKYWQSEAAEEQDIYTQALGLEGGLFCKKQIQIGDTG